MAGSQLKPLLLGLLLLCMKAATVSSHSRDYTAPNVTRLTDYFSHVSVDQTFVKSFGAANVKAAGNGSAATLALDKVSGSGLRSKNRFYYGFFSAAIKLPVGFSSGVVVAFYLSNSDSYPHNHDEIDIELLGRSKRDDWVVQTNIYANGSVSTGREEKFYFWFDPTQAYHYYSIIWNAHQIVFLIDNIPVRQFPNRGAFSSAYPSKPMSLHVTIWDGSEWATHGGKYPVNYKFAPFVAWVSDIEVSGCAEGGPPQASTPCRKSGSVSGLDPVDGEDFAGLSAQQSQAMDWARRKLMFYSYCQDPSRFKVRPPECRGLK